MKIVYNISIILFVLFGCHSGDKYEMKVVNGNTVRLNKKTGEMDIIRGNKLIHIKTPEDIELEKIENEDLAVQKDWRIGPIAALGIEKFNFKTNWSTSKMNYKLGVSPANILDLMIKRNDLGNFNLIAIDSSGFKLIDIPIYYNSLTRTKDEYGQTSGFYQIDDWPINSEDYRKIVHFKVTYTSPN